MIVYKAKNKINGKIYIGVTGQKIQERIQEHLGNRKHSLFGKALYKYGLESFDFSVIDSSLLREMAYEKEKHWIEFFNSVVPNGYNLTNGGEGRSGPLSDEHKNRISQAKTGKSLPPFSQEHRNRISERQKGKHRTEETRRKISQSLKGRIPLVEAKQKMSISHKKRNTVPPSKFEKGNVPWNKGIALSEETKKKLRKARQGNTNRLGKPHSEETKQKMRESRKNRKRNEKGQYIRW